MLFSRFKTFSFEAGVTPVIVLRSRLRNLFFLAAKGSRPTYRRPRHAIATPLQIDGQIFG